MYRSWGSNGLALHLDCNSPDGPGGGREGETSLRVIQEGLKGPMKVERHGVREPSVDGDPEPCRNEAQWEVTVRSGILTFILSVVAGALLTLLFLDGRKEVFSDQDFLTGSSHPMHCTLPIRAVSRARYPYLPCVESFLSPKDTRLSLSFHSCYHLTSYPLSRRSRDPF